MSKRRSVFTKVNVKARQRKHRNERASADLVGTHHEAAGILPGFPKESLRQANGVGTAAAGRGQPGSMHVCRSAAETARGPVIGLLLAWDREGGREGWGKAIG